MVTYLQCQRIVRNLTPWLIIIQRIPKHERYICVNIPGILIAVLRHPISNMIQAAGFWNDLAFIRPEAQGIVRNLPHNIVAIQLYRPTP